MQLETGQSTLVSSAGTHLDESYRNGVYVTDPEDVLTDLDGYSDDFKMGNGAATSNRELMVNAFKYLFSVILHVFGIKKAFQASLFDPVSGTNAVNIGGGGTLTHTDGILTSSNPPSFKSGTTTITYRDQFGGLSTMTFIDGRLTASSDPSPE
jgi:hypothetical protein